MLCTSSTCGNAKWSDDSGKYAGAMSNSIINNALGGTITSITDVGEKTKEQLSNGLGNITNAIGQVDSMTSSIESIPTGFKLPDLSLPSIPSLSGMIPSLPSLPDIGGLLPDIGGLLPDIGGLLPDITLPNIGLPDLGGLLDGLPNLPNIGMPDLLNNIDSIVKVGLDPGTVISNVGNSIKSLNVSSIKDTLKSGLLTNLADPSNIATLTIGVIGGNTGLISGTFSNIVGGAVDNSVGNASRSVFDTVKAQV